MPAIFKTSDGLELTFKNGKWTDGDLLFDSHLTGRDEQWPVKSNGDPLNGCHIVKVCTNCKDDVFFMHSCGAWVCESCGTRLQT